MTNPTYQPAPSGYGPPLSLEQAAARAWVEQIAHAGNNTQQGKLNATIDITLDAGVVSTTIIDPRLSVYSVILFMPLTANAAAELAGGTMWVSAQNSGEVTISHANDVSVDRTFRMLIIG